MPKEETIELRHIRGVIGEKESLPSLKATQSLSSGIKALSAKQSGIPHLIYTYGGLSPNKTLTLTASQSVVYSLWSDGTKLYAGVRDTSGVDHGAIIKIDLLNYVVESTLSIGDGVYDPVAMVSDGTFLYVAINTAPDGKIVKIRLSNFTLESTLTLTGDTPITAMVTDGTFLYCSLYKSPAEIVKVNIETFTKVGANLTLINNLVTSLYTDGWWLYAGHYSTPGVITKIDLDSFTERSQFMLGVVLGLAENNVTSLASDGNYLYIGLDNGFVIKFQLSTFNELGEYVTLEDSVKTLALDGTYLYAGIGSIAPAQINSIELSTFGQLGGVIPGYSSFAVGEGLIQSMFTDGNYIFTGMSDSPDATTIHQRYIIPESNLYERKIMNISETVTTINTNTSTTASGKQQVFQKLISSPANIGNVLIGSANGNIIIDSVIIYSRDTQTVDMTSCAIYSQNVFGSNLVTFIDSTDAIRANLDDQGKQVSWTGAVALSSVNDDFIVIDLVGTGAAAVDLQIFITFHSRGNGGEIL